MYYDRRVLEGEKIMKTISCIGSVLGLIAMCFGIYFWAEGNYASAETVKQVRAEQKMLEQRLDYKIKTDQEQSIRERIWKLKDRFGTNPKDPAIKEELRQLETDLGNVDTQIKVMEKK
jgi:hypothetical protein